MRLKSLFLSLLYTIMLIITLPVVMINSYYQSVYILEQNWLFLFLDGDGVLDLIEQTLVVLVIQYTIFPTKLRDIAYKIHIVSRYVVTGLYGEVIQHDCNFTYKV